ncbi:MAG TPA: OmpA family protein [Bacteroidales bacterium]|nr:OmpA family protein [Bacteroidales bacterium]
MKYSLIITAFFLAFIFLSPAASGQIKIDLKSKINREANRRANKRTDKTIKKSFDKLEEGLNDAVKKDDGTTDEAGKKKNNDTANKEGIKAQGNKQDESVTENKNDSPVLTWAKYDFVPGDQVIFEDNLEGEENGEFPSRWDLVRGTAEIAKLDGENVIMLREGVPEIVPYLKEPKKDYLPDVFTIEMDLYYPGDGTFNIYLYDRKNQKSGSPTGYTDVEVQDDQMNMGRGWIKNPEPNLKKERWMHIAIAYTNGKLKAYMDDTRLINIPHLDFNPSGLTLYTYHAKNDNRYYVKNVRIAKGGVKYYDRVMQNGKIIVNGIRFDVGKSTLKPESMGAINEIYNLMKENSDLKFSVEGHTDSQGDDDFNMKLSQDRAETVMNTLIKLGIPADRLSAKGWGESKPISNNASPEDMANNRRVEFVKM